MQPDDLADDELLSLPDDDPLLAKLTSSEATRRVRLQRKDVALRQTLGKDYDRTPASVSDIVTKQVPMAIGTGLLFEGAGRLIGAPLVKRVMAALRSGGVAAAKEAPLVGPPVRAGVNAAVESWRGSAPMDPAAAPRLAGKPPTMNQVLTEAVEAARQSPTPQSVSLPGGDTVRVTTPAPIVEAPTTPRRGSYSSEPTTASAPRGTSSDVPLASASRGSAPAASAARLTSEESNALRELVANGYDEADVVQAILQQRQTAVSLTAMESKEYQRLVGRGTDPTEAMRLIEGQRQLVQGKGLPTPDQASQAVADRNRTGRWD